MSASKVADPVGETSRCSFDDTQLRVGDPMYIEFPRLLGKVRDRVTITGWMQG
ncbi:MAG: hypothetical protein RLZZ200_172, partial [Pseudomonadota bacterium]